MTRSVADFIRDQDTARAARIHYRRDSRKLAAVARDLKDAGADDWANEVNRLGFVAYLAARAEFFDGEPQS